MRETLHRYTIWEKPGRVPNLESQLPLQALGTQRGAFSKTLLSSAILT